jgi:hypothetical protein
MLKEIRARFVNEAVGHGLSRDSSSSDTVLKRSGRDPGVASMPDGDSANENDGLRRLVDDPKAFFNRSGKFAIFDHKHNPARHFRMVDHERFQLLLSGGAARALRAMLENHNRFYLRSGEERA